MRPPIAVSWINVEEHFRKYYKGECNYPKTTDFLPFVWYDAMFDSFHFEVMGYLLPYYDKMETVSLWYSQLYLIIKSDLMFPGQVFHHLNVLAVNTLHRPYTRKGYTSDTVCAFLGDLIDEIPAEYHEQLQPKIQDWVNNLKQMEAVKYHCPLLPNVRRPLVPYGHLLSNVY